MYRMSDLLFNLPEHVHWVSGPNKTQVATTPEETLMLKIENSFFSQVFYTELQIN